MSDRRNFIADVDQNFDAETSEQLCAKKMIDRRKFDALATRIKILTPKCLLEQLNHTNSSIELLSTKKMVIGERFSTKKMSDSDTA